MEGESQWESAPHANLTARKAFERRLLGIVNIRTVERISMRRAG